MKDNKDLKKLITNMAKLLPITINDAAIIVASIYQGYDMPEVLKNIESLKEEIDQEIMRRRMRYQKSILNRIKTYWRKLRDLQDEVIKFQNEHEKQLWRDKK